MRTYTKRYAVDGVEQTEERPVALEVASVDWRGREFRLVWVEGDEAAKQEALALRRALAKEHGAVWRPGVGAGGAHCFPVASKGAVLAAMRAAGFAIHRAE